MMYQTIQAGRGMAALSVAAYHLSITMGDARYGGVPIFREWTARMSLGVDFFFVLSGFIILFAHNADLNRPDRLVKYATKRAVRVYPIYLLYSLCFSALVVIGIGSGSRLPDSFLGWLTSLTLLRFDSAVPPLPVAWTLFHEVLFYGVFATVIASKRAGLALLVVWALAILATFEYGPTAGSTPLRVFLSAYNLHFFVGMGAFLLHRHGSRALCNAALALGIALVAGALVADPAGTSNVAHAGIALGFGGVIAGLAAFEARLSSINLPVLTLLGDASYTIYLLHLAIEGLLMKLALRVGLDQIIGRGGVYGTVLVGTAVAGIAAYLLVEKPLLNAVRTWLGSRNPPSRELPVQGAGDAAPRIAHVD